MNWSQKHLPTNTAWREREMSMRCEIVVESAVHSEHVQCNFSHVQLSVMMNKWVKHDEDSSEWEEREKKFTSTWRRRDRTFVPSNRHTRERNSWLHRIATKLRGEGTIAIDFTAGWNGNLPPGEGEEKNNKKTSLSQEVNNRVRVSSHF